MSSIYDYGHLLLENTGRNIYVVWSDNIRLIIIAELEKSYFANKSKSVL